MPELGDPHQIVSAFVKQLCQRKESIPSELLKFKRDSLHPSFASLQDILISLASSYDQTFLIVDALDECPIDKRDRVIGCLIKAVELIPHARVFVTSRKEPDIAEAFKREGTPIIEVKVENVAEDIRSYVHAEVERLRSGYNGKKLYIGSDALEGKIVRVLTDKAEGM
jgi:hypothetical protein